MKHIIGIAEMKISSNADDILITYALGSCLGIAVYDAVARVGGLLHVMLPLSSINPSKAAKNPQMFIDTGVPELFRACYKAGAQKDRMIVKVAGGAALNSREGKNQFQIGRSNFLTLRKLLKKNNVRIHSCDVGENYSRTMSLVISTGDVILKTNTQEVLL